MPRANRPFSSVIVANRGEIACRVIETLKRLGIRAIAVYSEADRDAKHVRLADEAICIGGAAASESYLNVGAVIAAAQRSGAEALHPGYGFLSESTALAAACADAGIVFVGPSEHALSAMGDKIRSKRHVAQHGVPVTPGSDEPGQDDAQLTRAAERVGYPVLVKPSAGGGGKGMQIVQSAEQLAEALRTARRVAAAAFADDTLFLERLIAKPRHIEVQILADAAGTTIHLGERECSLQRRHQKVIEEAPSPLLDAETRARIGEAACAVARSVNYVGAGTVEFLVSDAAPSTFYFMEMNTRLQVEHPVTEMITGIDIVEWQLRVAAGQALPWAQSDIVLTGHAIEARVYAEDANRGFLPTTGRVLALSEAGGEGVRVDSALLPGLEITPNYDPMLAKVIAWAPDRSTALARLDTALDATVILGVDTNIDFLRGLLAHPRVRDGHLDTGLIEEHLAAPPVSPALLTSPVAVSSGVSPETGSTALVVAAALLYRRAAAWAQTPSSGAASTLWRAPSGWRLGGASAERPLRFVFCLPSESAGAASTSGQRGVSDAGGANPALREFAVHASAGALLVAAASSSVGDAADAGSIAVRFVADVSGDIAGSAGVVTVEVGGVTHPWHYAFDGAGVWLAAAGYTVRVEVQSRDESTALAVAAAREAHALGGHAARARPEVRTPMPGTVVAVHAESGGHVEVGAAVITIEAMKMEHQLVAAIAGVLNLTVAQGDTVKRDQIVATIDADADADAQVERAEP